MKKTYIIPSVVVVDMTNEGFLAHSQEGIDNVDKTIGTGDGTDIGSNGRNTSSLIWGEN